MKDELWVAEYSFAQRCFHHARLESSLESNQEIIERAMEISDTEKRIDNVYACVWIPFFVGTYDETSDKIDELREKMLEFGETYFKDLFVYKV